MAQQTINIGSNANDGTGDPLRTAFNKINANFSELYGASPFGQQITIDGNQLSASESNADLVLSGSGTGDVVAGAVRIHGTSITSDDSSQIQINENLDVGGNITASGNITATGNIFANGNINLGNAAGDQTKVVGVFEADQVQIDGTTITTNTTNGSLTIAGNGTGGVNVADITINDNVITTSQTNADLELRAAGTGDVRVGAVRFTGTEISSDDSTQITFKEALRVTGASALEGGLTVTGTTSVAGLTVSGDLSTNVIKSDDSTAIQIQDGLNISGTLSANTIDTNTISSGDSSAIQIQDSVNMSGTLTVAGTTNTADVATTGNTTISGSLTTGTFNVGDLNIDASGKFTTDTNGNIDFDPSGSGVVNFASDTNITGTATVTGQFNADNLRIDGNVISSTSGSITLSPVAGTNLVLGPTSGGVVTAPEFQATLGEFVTLRTDTLSTDTSNADLTIGTQGTGNIVLDTEKIARTGNLEFDVSGYVVIDSGAGDIYLKDDGTGFGILSNSAGNLEIKSGNTTALSMTGANVAAQGNLSVAGATISFANLPTSDPGVAGSLYRDGATVKVSI